MEIRADINQTSCIFLAALVCPLFINHIRSCFLRLPVFPINLSPYPPAAAMLIHFSYLPLPLFIWKSDSLPRTSCITFVNYPHTSVVYRRLAVITRMNYYVKSLYFSSFFYVYIKFHDFHTCYKYFVYY